MPSYVCGSCEMSIKPPTCGKCGNELAHRTIQVDNKEVAVAECTKGCGRIKSPLCCGKDMKPTS